MTLIPHSSSQSESKGVVVDILILGAGWTSTFLIPLLEGRGVKWGATTRDGRDGSVQFEYEPGSKDLSSYFRLPAAHTILITFPLKGAAQSRELVANYEDSHNAGTSSESVANRTPTTHRWIQLGSTGIFNAPVWNDDNSSYDKANARAQAEEELLSILDPHATVLNLSGLYGGERQPRTWVTRVAKTKAETKAKKCLHLVHGKDVARAILLCHEHFEKVGGKRWILTDLQCYDWWALFMMWGEQARDAMIEKGEEGAEGLLYEKWVLEAMQEEGIRALPRDLELLGRKVDGRGFWTTVESWPRVGRVV